MSELLLDAAGRRRSPATLPNFHAGRPPRNEGMRHPGFLSSVTARGLAAPRLHCVPYPTTGYAYGVL